MARNLPIISTNCQGLAEMFDNAALYAKMAPDYAIDANEYAEHMCRIIEDKRLRNKLSVLAYARYLKCYTAKKMCKQTLELYEKLTNND